MSYEPVFTEALPQKHFERWTGKPLRATEYCVRSWEHDEYCATVTWTTERELRVYHWHRLRNRWDAIVIPAALRFPLECWLDLVLLLPTTL